MNSVALGIVLGQLVNLAPSGYTGTLAITDRTEVRARTGYGTSRLGVDADNVLGTSMDFEGRRTSFGFSYGARFTLFDLTGTERSLDIMQFGRFGASWFDRNLRLTISLDGAIGTQNSASLAVPVTLTDVGMGRPPTNAPPPPTAPVNYQLPPGRLYTGSARVSLSASYTFDRRWQTGASAYAGMGGGFDYRSQRGNPPYRSAGGGVSVGYNLSRDDLTSTTANGSYTYVFDTPLPPEPGGDPFRYGGKYLNLGLFQSYSHNFNARTVGTTGLGFSHVRAVDRSDDGSFFGSALLGLSYSNRLQGAGVTAGGALAVGTMYNPIVAQVQQTASATFNLLYTARKWTAGAFLGTSTSLPLDTPGSSRTLSGSLGLGYTVNRGVQVQGGVRTSAQILPATAGSDLPPSYAAFLALVLATPPTRL